MGFLDDLSGGFGYGAGGPKDAMFGGQALYQNQMLTEAQANEARRNRELNAARLEEAEGRLDPWGSSETGALSAYMGELGLGPQSGRGLAYMDTQGYRDMQDEYLSDVGQTAATGGMTTYGGWRLKKSGEVGSRMQTQFQNNYMDMLSRMASPTTSTNISSLGMDKAATMGAQGAAAYGSMASNTAAAGRLSQQQANESAGTAMKVIGMFL